VSCRLRRRGLSSLIRTTGFDRGLRSRLGSKWLSDLFPLFFAVSLRGVGFSLDEGREEVADGVGICDGHGDVNCGPNSGESAFAGFVSTGEIVVGLDPREFCLLSILAGCGIGCSEHGSETNSFCIESAEDESVTTGSWDLHPSDDSYMAVPRDLLKLYRQRF